MFSIILIVNFSKNKVNKKKVQLERGMHSNKYYIFKLPDLEVVKWMFEIFTWGLCLTRALLRILISSLIRGKI